MAVAEGMKVGALHNGVLLPLLRVGVVLEELAVVCIGEENAVEGDGRVGNILDVVDSLPPTQDPADVERELDVAVFADGVGVLLLGTEPEDLQVLARVVLGEAFRVEGGEVRDGSGHHVTFSQDVEGLVQVDHASDAAEWDVLGRVRNGSPSPPRHQLALLLHPQQHVLLIPLLLLLPGLFSEVVAMPGCHCVPDNTAAAACSYTRRTLIVGSV